MAVGVEAFTEWLREDTWPSATCPLCLRGTLQRPKHFQYTGGDGVVSLDRRVGYRDLTDSVPGYFHAISNCSNKDECSCVFVAGDYRLGEPLPHDKWLPDEYRVRFVSAPLHLISLPDATPKRVQSAVANASQLLLMDPSAAANRLRQAVEELLTAQKVNRLTLDHRKDGTRFRRRLSLHSRIGLFRQTRPEVADLLEAVKWIGNDGSHESDLTAKEVLIGARILEVALKRLYETHPELDKQVKQIIKRKGIRPKHS